MKIAVCYELVEELNSNAFTGPLWIRGQAILEEVAGRWKVVAAAPVEDDSEDRVAIDALFAVIERVRHRLLALARSARDRPSFEMQVAGYFADSDPTLYSEWLALADQFEEESRSEWPFPVDSATPTRPNFSFDTRGEPRVRGFRVFVPGKLHQRRLID